MPDHPKNADGSGESTPPPDQSGPTELPRIPDMDGQTPSAPPDRPEDRFEVGTLLSNRYRIVSRLGQGGMGEVYRADDLKLGQTVALKFLPASLASDPKWLRRFHDEVRIARDIAHPNVCRTYDIVEFEGLHFIAMEYIDGEDLATLIKRIGRIQRDKAIQIARQLCLGVAAAHDKRVLHRDLKPANIMLDGRGNVRITDFGIAALADEMEGQQIQAGTPAYMAPEQLAGEDATVRSDLYSLGLVLYALFTGRDAFTADTLAELIRQRRSGTVSMPSILINDMDPVVERIIMRCLESDPRERPATAMAVAAALPGGDPLSLALEAGETPSPEMLAESGKSGALRPAVAVACIVALVVAVIVAVILNDRVNTLRLFPMDKPPAALVDRVEQILTDLGYPEVPADRAWWFATNWDYLEYLAQSEEEAAKLRRIGTGRPATLALEYRSSPYPMLPANTDGKVTWSDPPFELTRMMRVRVDPEGRLLSLQVRPPPQDDTWTNVSNDDSGDLVPAPDQPVEPDWAALFAAANLDMNDFEIVEPEWTPKGYCDTRRAWIGEWPGEPGLPLRIEAGGLHGRPVLFRMVGDWTRDWAWEWQWTAHPAEVASLAVFLCLFAAVPLVGGLIGLHNLRVGRGDRRGAWRLAVYVFCVSFVLWLLTADHALVLSERLMLARAFGKSIGLALICWFFYIAIEPYARRFMPHAIISWTRLLSGRWRDPLVGRDVMFGCLAGIAWQLARQLTAPLIGWQGTQRTNPELVSYTDSLLGGRHVLAQLFAAQDKIGMAIGIFVLLLLLRIVLRKQWLAVAVIAVTLVFLLTQAFTGNAGQWIQAGLFAAIIIVTMVRFGLLSLIVMTFVFSLFWYFPSTFDFSAWYAGAGLLGPLTVLALGGIGFSITVAGRPLFKDELLA